MIRRRPSGARSTRSMKPCRRNASSPSVTIRLSSSKKAASCAAPRSRRAGGQRLDRAAHVGRDLGAGCSTRPWRGSLRRAALRPAPRRHRGRAANSASRSAYAGGSVTCRRAPRRCGDRCCPVGGHPAPRPVPARLQAQHGAHEERERATAVGLQPAGAPGALRGETAAHTSASSLRSPSKGLPPAAGRRSCRTWTAAATRSCAWVRPDSAHRRAASYPSCTARLSSELRPGRHLAWSGSALAGQALRRDRHQPAHRLPVGDACHGAPLSASRGRVSNSRSRGRVIAS